MVAGNVIKFETGELTTEEIESIFDTLPVDITFIDKDNVVKYFSQTKDRVFIRTKSVLGLKVEQCHPAKSIDKVMQVVEILKSGKRDYVDFWINYKGRFIYIRYFAVRNKKRKFLGTMEVKIRPFKMRFVKPVEMKINERELIKRMIMEYEEIRKTIEKRLNEFKQILNESDDRRVFSELAFCLLTPQSKAKVCWKAIESLMESGELLSGAPEDIEKHLKGVRFKRNKARYIVQARENLLYGKKSLKKFILSFKTPEEARSWLVKNIKGMGMKEASHFLRNISLGENLAILDRHILNGLEKLGVINEVPKTLTRKRYLEIEDKMRRFATQSGIPMAHLDLLLWYMKTGEVFK